MERTIIVTTDGSHSISIPEMGVTYHSSHGAIQESMHVFIKAGLDYAAEQNAIPQNVSILEMGFGTGLNALLALIEAEQNKQLIYYETIELYPLEQKQFEALNYCQQLNRPDMQPLFNLMHAAGWDEEIAVSPYFKLVKRKVSLVNFSSPHLFDIVFFDAFAPEKQPGLWTADIFKKLNGMMVPGAILTTYCSKSIVRKAMAEAGLNVEKIPGPPHKREMVRASKSKHV